MWRSFLSSEPPEQADINLPPISLMWPGQKPEINPPTMAWQRDLAIREVVNRLAIDRRYVDFIFQSLITLVADPAVIRWRQAVLRDFVNNPTLAEQIGGLLPRLVNLRQGTALLGRRQRNLLLETADRLSELELYTAIIIDLHTLFEQANLESEALCDLKKNLATVISDDQFQRLVVELPALREPLQNVKSLTIGINLDLELRPTSAVLLGINDVTLDERVSWLERLIGTRSDEMQEAGIAALHNLPKDPDMRMYSELFQDLDRLMTQTAQPIARALNRYVRTSSATLMRLEYELAFFVAGFHLTQLFQERGITACQPEALPVAERQTHISDLRNLNLVLAGQTDVIPSDVRFDSEGRIAILTGPNSGGKTTYLQAIGLAQVFFQAGWHIPAQSAQISPVETILTHYPQLETHQQGRLAEESERLRTLFQQATAHSLVLLNETFSSTASGEAVYLAQDVLCALRTIGVRAVYATHFIELVELIDEIETSIAGDSMLCSLVAGVRLLDNGRAVPTHKITRGKPLGRSYAQEIARRYGISLEQILESRRES